ncbi:MAG: DUF4922 domain-containing protein, partial [Marinilabiliaceae bacterium]|nr:DUF4922 domain-containing protein [Marinilabiliaceae bacterium]
MASTGYNDIIAELIKNQLREWSLAQENYNGLKRALYREIVFDRFSVLLQFNPHRIVSSAANVDSESIKKRACFLCSINLPFEQKRINMNERFQILVNPYPIFDRHLTIVTFEHSPQEIDVNFQYFLEAVELLTDYVVFYNGPRCGASAPDHMHFQAGNRGFLPVENDFKSGFFIKLVGCDDRVKIYKWQNYQRSVITFESDNAESMKNVLQKFYRAFNNDLDEEPMMNLIGYKDDGLFLVHWFPRKKHRSSHYFDFGEKQIVVSPASVDLGGVIVTPREEDFYKITKEHVVEMFD